MTSKTKVYLVGEHDAQTTNSWVAMTNSMDKAVETLATIPNGQLKVIEVSDDSK